MSVLSHHRSRKSCIRGHQPEARLAASRNGPQPFHGIWNDIVSLASLAAVLGTVMYLVLSR